jgi:hypothetical protein
MPNEFMTARRSLLKGAAGVTAVAVGLGFVGTATAEASGMTKASVQYQTKPKGGHQCSGCALFIPGPTAKATGKCKAVAGAIEPTGWCTLWSPKS